MQAIHPFDFIIIVNEMALLVNREREELYEITR